VVAEILFLIYEITISVGARLHPYAVFYKIFYLLIYTLLYSIYIHACVCSYVILTNIKVYVIHKLHSETDFEKRPGFVFKHDYSQNCTFLVLGMGTVRSLLGTLCDRMWIEICRNCKGQRY
jgi:hypothetical protein